MGAEVVVLSPHRDDAAFSLYFCLRGWAREGVQIRIINFFTRSAYGPHSGFGRDPIAISNLRKREDRRALKRIDSQIKVEDLGFVDAPIRLNIEAVSVCLINTAEHVEELSECLAKTIGASGARCFMAPLALGNHVDHVAVRRAAIRAVRPPHLAFYEDLPYAAWTPESLIKEKVNEAERSTYVTLKPYLIRFGCSLASKARAVSTYSSQIGRDEASAIARFAIRYRRGERIWLPKPAAIWRPLINRYVERPK